LARHDAAAVELQEREHAAVKMVRPHGRYGRLPHGGGRWLKVYRRFRLLVLGQWDDLEIIRGSTGHKNPPLLVVLGLAQFCAFSPENSISGPDSRHFHQIIP